MGRLKGLLFSVALLPSLTLASEWVYTVQPGDNLWNLTERYMLSMRYWLPLLELNGIEQPKRMPPGTRLRMPLQWSKVSRVGARIVDVHGKVEIRDRQGTQRPAHTGELLRAHDQVVTEPGSSLLLEFGDKTQLLLTGDSSLELEKMQGYGEGDVIDSRMHLRRGGSESLVNPDKKSGSRFEIFTPSALTSVRGTGFRITNEDAGKASKVEVTSGRVQVVEPKRTLDLKGGFGLIARQGKPPSKPVRLLPAPALAAVPELIEDPVPTFELAPLAGAKGYRVQVSARGDFTAPTIDNRYSDEQIRIDLSSLPDGDYQMRIRGIDSQGIEGRDAIRLVKLNIRPPPPFQVFPTAESAFDDPRPKFEWAKPEGGSGYRFELARDPEMDKPILVLPRLSSEQVTPSGDLEPGPYYWRVSTLDENGKAGHWDTPSHSGFCQRRLGPSRRRWMIRDLPFIGVRVRLASSFIFSLPPTLSLSGLSRIYGPSNPVTT